MDIITQVVQVLFALKRLLSAFLQIRIENIFAVSILGTFSRRSNFNNVEQRYDRILSVLSETDYSYGKVLDAECYVLDAQAVWEKALKKLKENPLYFTDRKE